MLKLNEPITDILEDFEKGLESMIDKPVDRGAAIYKVTYSENPQVRVSINHRIRERKRLLKKLEIENLETF